MMTPQENFELLLSAWNIDSAKRRGEIVRQTLNDSFIYADPHRPGGPITDHDAFDEFLEIFRSRVEGVIVSPGDIFSFHNGYARTSFVIKRSDAIFATGEYFLEFTEAGRISKMVGFVDEPSS